MKRELNLKTFVLAALFILIGVLAYKLINILLVLFIAFILFSGLKPIVDYLEKHKVKRWIAVTLTYLGIASILFVLFYFIFNETVDQVRIFLSNFEFKSDNILAFIDTNFPFLSADARVRIAQLQTEINSPGFLNSLTSNEVFRSFLGSFNTVGSEGLRLVGRVVGGLFTIFMIVFISIYMVIPKKDFYEGGIDLLPEKFASKMIFLLDKIKANLGAWLGGQILLMLIIGIATYVIVILPALFVPNYELGQFAFLIAVIAGFLEAIPNIGPILTLVFTIFVAVLLGSPVGVLIFLFIAFIVLQQLEGLFIVPVVMKRAMDINPILSILGLLAGFELTNSPIGALLAIPVLGVIQIVVLEVLKDWKIAQEKS